MRSDKDSAVISSSDILIRPGWSVKRWLLQGSLGRDKTTVKTNKVNKKRLEASGRAGLQD